MKHVLIASDHAGVLLKAEVITHLHAHNYECCDLGTHTADSVDYPDFAHALCDILGRNPGSVGILICGTGIGMSIVANRYSDVRCAVAVTPEMASMARQHNDANIVALGARLIDTDTAISIVDAFLGTKFEGGRHDARLQKIDLSIGFATTR